MNSLSRKAAILLGLLALGATSLIQVFGQASARYGIEGTVVSSDDGAVITHCRLTVRKAQDGEADRGFGSPRSPSDTAETDDHGHFEIVVASPGHWRLTGTARGFRSQSLQQHDSYFSAVVITSSAPKHSVTLKLDRDALVTGVVLDEAGEAVRRANVQIISARSQGEEPRMASGHARPAAITDDLGRYELPGLAPGDYRVSVQAQPWYATTASSIGRSGSPTLTSLSTSDPTLDVVYAQTWFPGVDDPASAEKITIHPGERREVDFSLQPVPSTHLRLNVPGISPPSEESRGMPSVRIERLSAGTFNSVPSQVIAGANRQSEIAGLAAGFYRLLTRTGSGPDGEQVSFLNIAGGSGSQIEAASAVPAARVHLLLRGKGSEDGVDVTLVDASSGTVFPLNAGQTGLRRHSAGGSDSSIVDVPEGTYQVFLSGAVENTFLQNLVLNGKEVSGQLITVRQGDTSLVLQLAEGRSAVRGIAKAGGQVSEGAMVLLVPASLGDPASLAVLRRAETNTDGSFELRSIVPGDYILAVIEGGWLVNWRDTQTLARYLVHGTPLILRPGMSLQQDVFSQSP